MERVLEGRTALVTGSTSGIGHGIALLFAQAGAKVMLNGFGKPEEIAEARSSVGKAMGRGDAPYSAADLSKPDATRQMVLDAQKELGSLDILVNNAGIQFVAPVEEFPEVRFDAIIAINMSSNFHAIKAALPMMRQRNFGRIINIASAHGLIGSEHKVAYVTAKHGVVGMTKVVAIDTAKTQITCNASCPGFVRTPLAEKQVEDLAKEHNVSPEQALTDLLLVHQPSKRWIEVPEVAQMALYLAGPNSAGTTGAALSIDGGWFAS